MILGTFNGASIISVPWDTLPRIQGPSSIEWNPQEVVATAASPFTGQTQVYDWQTSWWEAQVSFPSMNRYSADALSSFLLECRGQSNVFSLGDPKAAIPKGVASGSPVVNGAGQSGYFLATRGWTPSITSILLTGDFLQVGYRLYKVLDSVNSDSSGDASIHVWPNLRDLPADGTQIITRNCKGLFRLSANSGNKWSTNPGTYGFTGFSIREAI